ncbi:MAG: RNA polymerase sigma factor [Bacteroidota bacterium]
MTFIELYNTYNKQVFNTALHYVQNIEDAEEITQDVFVSIHKSLDSFQENAKYSTWIHRITINKSLDYIKAKKAKKRFAFITSLFHKDEITIKYDSINSNHPGIIIEQKEATDRIFKYINQLSDNQKTVIILSKIEGKNQKEIAEIMNLTVKAVESLLQRAKNNLQINLNKNEGI